MGFFKKLGRIAGRVAPFALGGLVGGAAFNMARGRGPLGGREGMGGGGENYQPGSNPALSGMPYLERIPGAVGPYYDPFIESGQQAEGMTNPIYEQMASSPGAFIENLMRGYTPSRGYQFKQNEMERAMRNAAAHGGFVGTPYNQQQQAELTQGLLSQDMQDFLGNLFAAQGRGLEGQGRRQQRGFEASTGYGDILGSQLAQLAGLGTQGQAQANQIGADVFSNRLAARNSARAARMGFLGNLIGGGARMLGGGF